MMLKEIIEQIGNAEYQKMLFAYIRQAVTGEEFKTEFDSIKYAPVDNKTKNIMTYWAIMDMIRVFMGIMLRRGSRFIHLVDFIEMDSESVNGSFNEAIDMEKLFAEVEEYEKTHYC